MYAVVIQYNRRGAAEARLAHNQKDGRSKLLDDNGSKEQNHHL